MDFSLPCDHAVLSQDMVEYAADPVLSFPSILGTKDILSGALGPVSKDLISCYKNV
jgi:hypothetical protein